jgi:hypothetical protein
MPHNLFIAEIAKDAEKPFQFVLCGLGIRPVRQAQRKLTP